MDMSKALTRAMMLAASLVVFGSDAMAQGRCSDRRELLDHLGAKYKEGTVATGLMADGRLLEVLAAEDGKTWSIILSTAQGTSCLVAAGESWQLMRLKKLVSDPEA